MQRSILKRNPNRSACCLVSLVIIRLNLKPALSTARKGRLSTSVQQEGVKVFSPTASAASIDTCACACRRNSFMPCLVALPRLKERPGAKMRFRRQCLLLTGQLQYTVCHQDSTRTYTSGTRHIMRTQTWGLGPKTALLGRLNQPALRKLPARRTQHLMSTIADSAFPKPPSSNKGRHQESSSESSP